MSIQFSLTNRHIEDARKEGISRIPILSQGKWTDLNPSDPGIIIVDYIHALADMIQFYQDHQALEAYLASARERKNILKLAKQYSYKIKTATGAKCLVKFFVDTPLETNVFIPKYTELPVNMPDGDNLTFLTMEDATMYAGQSEIYVPVMEGVLKTFTYKGTGEPNQIVELPDDLIDGETIYVFDNNNEVWKEIDFIFYSNENEKNYQLDVTHENKIILRFGDGNRGKIPMTTDELTIKYIKTNGSKGNVGIGKINTIGTQLRDSQGSSVNLSVINEEPSSGGKGFQTDEEIKEQVPKVLKTVWKAVTTEDFETLAKEVNGVKKAIALDIKKAPDMCLHHEVKIVIIPDGGSKPSKYLKDQVLEYLIPRSIPPTVIQIIDPVYVDIDLNIAITTDSRYLKEEVVFLVQEALANYFEQISDFGQTVRYTSLISLVSQVEGVRYIDYFSLKEDIVLNQVQVPRLGNVEITVTGEV